MVDWWHLPHNTSAVVCQSLSIIAPESFTNSVLFAAILQTFRLTHKNIITVVLGRNAKMADLSLLATQI
jgi:hypothetical protein